MNRLCLAGSSAARWRQSFPLAHPCEHAFYAARRPIKETRSLRATGGTDFGARSLHGKSSYLGDAFTSCNRHMTERIWTHGGKGDRSDSEM